MIAASGLFDADFYRSQLIDFVDEDIDFIEHYLTYGSENQISPSPYFDAKWYLSVNPDVLREKLNPLLHFMCFGRFEGRQPIPIKGNSEQLLEAMLNNNFEAQFEEQIATIAESGLFDETHYLAQLEVPLASYVTPIMHFLVIGSQKGFTPSKWFDSVWYLEFYQDLSWRSINPLLHYLNSGKIEGRRPLPPDAALEVEAIASSPLDDAALVEASHLFDPQFYTSTYIDVASCGMSPLEHYLCYGWREFRVPSPYFNPHAYVRDNPDVEVSDINPLVHYLRFGRTEGRSSLFSRNQATSSGQDLNQSLPSYVDRDYARILASGLFDEHYYKAANPDVDQAAIIPLVHFCKSGWKEMRRPTPTFDPAYYIKKYADVARADVNPFAHWIAHGRSEGRTTELVSVAGPRKKVPNAPTIIFISHEASRTGAPAVLLALMTWIKSNTMLRFAIIVGHGGPWNDRFHAIAPTLVMSDVTGDMRQTLRDFCGNHVKTVYCNTIISGIYADHLKFLKAKFVAHVHEMESLFKLFDDKLHLLTDLCHDYVAVSEGSVTSLRSRISADNQITLINPFIAIAAGLPALRPRSSERTPIVIGCGTVEKRKGFDIFCDVAKRFRDRGAAVTFQWIGACAAGGLNPADEIRVRNVEGTVDWLGAKNDPSDFFRQADVFFLPSREDPFPLACLEAAAQGLPIVCFDASAGGMHTFVGHDCGTVVPYLDVDAAAAALAYFLDDETARVAAGVAARDKVRTRHSTDAVAPQILALLDVVEDEMPRDEFESFCRVIDRYDAISFDIFDTLVTRRVSDPNVAFDLMEFKHTQGKPGPLGFHAERMQVAGEVLAKSKGMRDDVVIDEIYEEMPFYSDISVERDVELALCVPHPLGLRLYQYAKANEKTVFITSDMYLDETTIIDILANCGIWDYDQLHLSSKQGLKKETGRLYSLVIAGAARVGVASDKILHIGDNWLGDIEACRRAGLAAVRFSPLQEDRQNLIALTSDAHVQLSQIGRIWEAFSSQAARLWGAEDSALSKDFFVRLGFELTGPYSVMMAMYVRKIVRLYDAKRVFFLARDGRVIKTAFDALYEREESIESRYVHLSRATVLLATLEFPLSDSDVYFLSEGVHLGTHPIRYYLAKAGLEIDNQEVASVACRRFGSLDAIPRWSDRRALADLLRELSSEIYAASAHRRRALEAYLDATGILSEDKAVIVDVGWLLNIQSRLQRFITTLQRNVQLIGVYVGSRDRADKSLVHHSLLFERGEPAVFANLIAKHTTLFEVLFSSPEPSAKDIRFDGEDVSIVFKDSGGVPSAEWLVAQKVQLGSEFYLRRFLKAKNQFFPDEISRDYMMQSFRALVETPSLLAKAHLSQFAVSLGGQHDLHVTEDLLGLRETVDYAVLAETEYFDPIHFGDQSNASVVVVTSAGLVNGSTRYRAVNLCILLRNIGISSVLIHSETALGLLPAMFALSPTIVFQRCFRDQGNVAKIHDMARDNTLRVVMEMDDLIFPTKLDCVGSVRGGEWNRDEAMFVANAYEAMLKSADAVIVSTPGLSTFVADNYQKECVVLRNRVESTLIRSRLRAPVNVLKMLYSSGTLSHKQDFQLFEADLFDFLTRNAAVFLDVLGATQVSDRILALSNVRSYPVLPYAEMIEFIGEHDLLLVPLEDNVFNKAKSYVKFLEAAAVGVPVAVSRIGEFRSCVRSFENGLAVGPDQSWTSIFNWAWTNRGRLADLGSVAQRDIIQWGLTKTFRDGEIGALTGVLFGSSSRISRHGSA